MFGAMIKESGSLKEVAAFPSKLLPWKYRRADLGTKPVILGTFSHQILRSDESLRERQVLTKVLARDRRAILSMLRTGQSHRDHPTNLCAR